jgi:hypothetical protein
MRKFFKRQTHPQYARRERNKSLTHGWFDRFKSARRDSCTIVVPRERNGVAQKVLREKTEEAQKKTVSARSQRLFNP